MCTARKMSTNVPSSNQVLPYYPATLPFLPTPLPYPTTFSLLPLPFLAYVHVYTCSVCTCTYIRLEQSLTAEVNVYTM